MFLIKTHLTLPFFRIMCFVWRTAQCPRITHKHKMLGPCFQAFMHMLYNLFLLSIHLFLHWSLTTCPTNLLKVRPEILIEFVVFPLSLFHSTDRSVTAKSMLICCVNLIFSKKINVFSFLQQGKTSLICYIPFLCIINHNSLSIKV